MKKFWVIPVLLMVTAMLVLPAQSQAEVKIGVLAKRGASKCIQKWGATGTYLTEKLGTPVSIVPLKFDEVNPAVAGGKVDFILANSAFYVELEKNFGAQAVATLINSRKGNALSEFSGVILVKNDSPIQSLADVAGKKFMVVKKSSFGGSQMAWRLLVDNGIDPEKDCAEVMIGKKHDNVVLSVLHGQCEVGTVRSDTMERMADEGTIDMADFRIINQVEDDFPFVHSTQLYPEWPIAATRRADPEMSKKIAEALMAMAQDDAAAQAAKCVGWAAPADYTPVRECLQAIKYGAFAAIQ